MNPDAKYAPLDYDKHVAPISNSLPREIITPVLGHLSVLLNGQEPLATGDTLAEGRTTLWALTPTRLCRVSINSDATSLDTSNLWAESISLQQVSRVSADAKWGQFYGGEPQDGLVARAFVEWTLHWTDLRLPPQPLTASQRYTSLAAEIIGVVFGS